MAGGGSQADLQVAPHTVQASQTVVAADLLLAAVAAAGLTAASHPHV